MDFIKRVLVAILFCFLFLVFSKSVIQAEQGITVNPSIIRLDLSEDKPEVELYYKNNTRTQVQLSFTAWDFSEEEETGRVKFLKDQDAKNYQYSLTSWIAFEKQSITLFPNEGQSVKIFINKDRLTSGGHYASIQAQLLNPEDKDQVPIKAILSTLFFVRTATGSEREEMELQTVSPIRTFLGFPDTFLLRLKNKGNVELIPHGLIDITDMFGNKVAKGIINEGSLITLPESIRRFDVPISKVNSFIVPGIYKADINVGFGKEDKTFHHSISFISQGSINLLPVVVLLSVALLFWKKRKSKH